MSPPSPSTPCVGCRTELPPHAVFCVECGLTQLHETDSGTVIRHAPGPAAPEPYAEPIELAEADVELVEESAPRPQRAPARSETVAYHEMASMRRRPAVSSAPPPLPAKPAVSSAPRPTPAKPAARRIPPPPIPGSLAKRAFRFEPPALPASAVPPRPPAGPRLPYVLDPSLVDAVRRKSATVGPASESETTRPHAPVEEQHTVRRPSVARAHRDGASRPLPLPQRRPRRVPPRRTVQVQTVLNPPPASGEIDIGQATEHTAVTRIHAGGTPLPPAPYWDAPPKGNTQVGPAPTRAAS